MSDTSLTVVVVDDDDITSELLERALRKTSCTYRIVTAMDGREALDRLRGSHGEPIRRPYVVLLDLNMPRMNGFEFLEEVRADPRLRDSVIFVLTTSDADTDRARAYQDHIAGYMVKSAVGPQFARVVSLLREYDSAVALPT